LRALRATHFRLDADTTVDAFLCRHRQPPRLCEFLWRPLCLAALNTPPDAASAQVFVNVLRDTLADDGDASDLLLPRVDLSTLFPDPAERYLARHGGQVLRGTAVRRIEKRGTRFVLHTGSGSRQQNHGPYTHVILATAPRQTQALIAGLPALSALARTITTIGFESIVTCYFAYPPATRLPQPMLGLTGGIAQWIFDRGQITGPPGIIAAVISARGSHSQLSREDLATRLHDEIAVIVPGLLRPSWTQVIHDARATFACVPAMSRPQTQTPLPGLLLAGDYVASDYPATIEAAVKSGVKAASCVLACLKTASS
jgi:squalene-associated FAD-dependent desaturase